jgi:hypothetical protein
MDILTKKISMFPIYSSSNGGGGFATEEGIHIDNIDLMGIGNVNLSENLKLTTLLVNIAEINTVFRGGEYRNFLINTSKFVYGNSLLANRNTFLNESNTKQMLLLYLHL